MKKLLIIPFFFQTLCAQEKGDDPMRMMLGNLRAQQWKHICWAGQVVVLEGELTYKVEKAEADVEITVNVPLREKEMKKENKTHKKVVMKYRVVKLTPNRFLFASPGMTSLVSGIGGLEHGEMTPQNVLVRLYEDTDKPIYKNHEKAVYVMTYNPIVREYPLVIDSIIAEDQMVPAETMFKLRNKFDHRSSPIPEGQSEKPAPLPESKAEGDKNPQSEPQGDRCCCADAGARTVVRN